MKREEAPSYPISIFMAGDYARAVALCRDYCGANPFCVTVKASEYVYTGGQEAGFVVGIINYPRFPATPDALWEAAERIAAMLRVGLEQQSYSIQAPDRTVWISHRAA